MLQISLRDYQAGGVTEIREQYIAGYRAPLYVLPTGGGKTIVFTHIGSASAARKKNVLILVHRIELVRQTVEKLIWAGVKCGVIHKKYTPDYTASVQVASVQTLVKRLHKIPIKFDLIIVDEAHHATAGSWKKIIEYYPDARILGVTATPIRSDGAGLDAIFDSLVIGPQISELIGAGHLVPPIVYAPAQRIDFTGIKISMGDYDQKEVELRVDKPTVTGDAVAHYAKLCPGTPAVAFCISVAHAEHVAEQFRAAGFRAASVDGTTDDDERKRILDGLGDGSIDVVCSCSIISEGTDIPAIGCAILLRPTQSLSLYIQQVGRALRLMGDKSHAIILDHVGNCFIHGMPDEDREWSLEGVKKSRKKGEKDKPARVMQCMGCLAVHAPAPSCPQCGFVHPVQSREIEEVDGELTAVTPEMKKAISIQRKIEVYNAKSLEDLVKIGAQRGYGQNWAKHVHAARNKKKTGI